MIARCRKKKRNKYWLTEDKKKYEKEEGLIEHTMIHIKRNKNKRDIGRGEKEKDSGAR